MHRSVAYCGSSQIPLPVSVAFTPSARNSTGPASTSPRPSLSRQPSSNGEVFDSPERWRGKYEDAERKRKQLLAKSERSTRELSDLERRYRQLSDEHNLTRNELKDKDVQLLSLRNVSEKVYKEYDTLKNQYDVETGAMHKAMQHAGQWYKQNRQLKRQSAVLVQKYLEAKPNGIIDINIDDTDSNIDGVDDLEGLRIAVQNMSEEIAKLQSDLNTARLQEFEATEQCVNLTQELEQERKLRLDHEKELEKMRVSRDHLARVSRLVADEVVELRNKADRNRDTAESMRGEVRKAIIERNVMARQSAMLVGEMDPEERVMKLLQEVGELKAALETERCNHLSEIADLQEKLQIHDETDPQLEIFEEKLKLAEFDLEAALNRAEKAELELQERLNSNRSLEVYSEIDQSPISPPLPPPPPPPPMADLNLNISPAKIKLKHTESAMRDMATMLGIQHGCVKKMQQQNGGAIDEIINQIKGGRFNLRPAEQNAAPKAKEEAPAVKEMLNILSTLRRPKKQRMTNLSVSSTKYLADVQL